MQFRPPLPPQVRDGAQPNGLREVTVTDRYVPLVTAAYGMWVARPARNDDASHWGDGSQLGQRVRPVLGSQPIVGKPLQTARQPFGDVRSTWCGKAAGDLFVQ